MSFNRENVIWQSADGTWNRGFYTVHDTGDWGDDYDPEWDVEYDTSSFEWVATGLATEQGAIDVWDGANPGGWSFVRWCPEMAAECERYDTMVKTLRALR